MSYLSVKYHLDKTSKKPEKTIFAYIGGIKNKRPVYHIGFKIHPNNWDKKNQQPKKTSSDYSIINSHLKYISSKINDLNARLFRNETTISIDSLKKELDKIFNKELAVDSNKKFYNDFDDFLNRRKNQLAPRTIQKYQGLKNHLLEFEEKHNQKISYESIDSKFRDNLMNYFIEVAKLKNNTIEKYFSCLNTFINWALDENLHTNLKFKKFKFKRYIPTLVTLTLKEFNTLYKYDFSKKKNYETIRDIFCFMVFTGQRHSDICNLRFSEIKGNCWELTTVKTKDFIKIPRTAPAIKIIKKYTKQGDSFPNITLPEVNKIIKKACKEVGITSKITDTGFQGINRIDTVYEKWELISTKTARKTFTTLSHQFGLDLKNITDVTNHKKLEMLKHYLNSDYTHTKKKMDDSWGKKFK